MQLTVQELVDRFSPEDILGKPLKLIKKDPNDRYDGYAEGQTWTISTRGFDADGYLRVIRPSIYQEKGHFEPGSYTGNYMPMDWDRVRKGALVEIDWPAAVVTPAEPMWTCSAKTRIKISDLLTNYYPTRASRDALLGKEVKIVANGGRGHRHKWDMARVGMTLVIHRTDAMDELGVTEAETYAELGPNRGYPNSKFDWIAGNDEIEVDWLESNPGIELTIQELKDTFPLELLKGAELVLTDQTYEDGVDIFKVGSTVCILGRANIGGIIVTSPALYAKHGPQPGDKGDPSHIEGRPYKSGQYRILHQGSRKVKFLGKAGVSPNKLLTTA